MDFSLKYLSPSGPRQGASLERIGSRGWVRGTCAKFCAIGSWSQRTLVGFAVVSSFDAYMFISWEW
jgi:hypothetical protein